MKYVYAYFCAVLAIVISAWYIFTAATLFTLISAVTVLVAAVGVLIYRAKRL